MNETEEMYNIKDIVKLWKNIVYFFDNADEVIFKLTETKKEEVYQALKRWLHNCNNKSYDIQRYDSYQAIPFEKDEENWVAFSGVNIGYRGYNNNICFEARFTGCFKNKIGFKITLKFLFDPPPYHNLDRFYFDSLFPMMRNYAAKKLEEAKAFDFESFEQKVKENCKAAKTLNLETLIDKKHSGLVEYQSKMEDLRKQQESLTAKHKEEVEKIDKEIEQIPLPHAFDFDQLDKILSPFNSNVLREMFQKSIRNNGIEEDFNAEEFMRKMMTQRPTKKN